MKCAGAGGLFLSCAVAAFPLIAAGAHGAPSAGVVETCRGVIISVSGERLALRMEGGADRETVLSLDAKESLAFRGMRALRLDELRPGMRVEIDCRRAPAGGPPLATWIEVEEGGKKR